jgi:hypothetical protein
MKTARAATQPARDRVSSGMGVVLPETGLRARLPSSLGLLPWALETRASLCAPPSVPRLHEPTTPSPRRRRRHLASAEE